MQETDWHYRERLTVVRPVVSSIGGVATVADSAVAGDTVVAVVNSGDDTNVVGMAGGVGVGRGEAVSDLLDGAVIWMLALSGHK